MKRATKALISFQRAALTRESDFPGECLNNFANACSTMENSEENVHGDIVAQKVNQKFEVLTISSSLCIVDVVVELNYGKNPHIRT